MPSSSACRLDTVLSCISDQWTLSVIHKLSNGPRRTLELYGAFKGMSTKTLTGRLKKLERDGVVERVSYPESPPRVEYSLTEKGRELMIVLRAIAEVAFKWSGEMEAAKDSIECRACRTLYNGLVIEETRPPEIEEVERDRPRARMKSRKLTDVTLL